MVPRFDVSNDYCEPFRARRRYELNLNIAAQPLSGGAPAARSDGQEAQTALQLNPKLTIRLYRAGAQTDSVLHFDGATHRIDHAAKLN